MRAPTYAQGRQALSTSALLIARTREANRRPVITGTSQAAQLVAQSDPSCRTDVRPLAAGCAQPLYTYNTAAGRQGRAIGPRLRRAPDGAPLTAVSGGVVRLGHARTPPRKAQLSEPERPPHP
jgi:hypothetical protein